jgi:hypothetical protein
MMKVIGLELRLIYQHPKFGCQRKEIAVVPCDIEMVMEEPYYYQQTQQQYVEITMHTSQGDVTLNGTLPFILDDDTRGLRSRSR